MIDTTIEVKWRSLTQARYIENYDFRNSRPKIQLMLYYLIGVSFLSTLVIYKAYCRSRHWYRDLEFIYLVWSYCVCASLGFAIKCFLIFIVYEVKNFAAWKLSNLIAQLQSKFFINIYTHINLILTDYIQSIWYFSSAGNVGT